MTPMLPGALAPLAKYRQFILVQFIPKLDDAGNVIPNKTDKHPINPFTFMRHSAHDPVIWMAYTEAAALAERMGAGYGVGFVITEHDDIVCMDMDSCTTLNGQWIPEVATMVAALPGANELSNSGQGLHVWATYRGKAPEHAKKSAALRNGKWLELYTELRFIALGTAATGCMGDVTDILPAFIEKYFPPRQDNGDDAGWTDGPCEGYTETCDDNELIRRACAHLRQQPAGTIFNDNATPVPQFVDLWTCNVDALSKSFPPKMPGKLFDASDADFALAKELAYWTGKDCDRIARMMHMSALVRDKWQPSVHRKYFGETIVNAVAECQAFYKARALAPSAPVIPPGGIKLLPSVIDHQGYIGRDEIAPLFHDCVYIQDSNAVLLPDGDIVDQARFKVKFAGYTFNMDNENRKVSTDAYDAFINNSIVRFPRVQGTTFEPKLDYQMVIERAGRTWINTYKAPFVERRPGDVTPFMNLLHKLLPNGDDALILLTYMAAVVQNPGVKFRWAPFIQGTRGNGKSTLINCLKHALGNKYIFSIKAGMIENNFNSWLENNVLYVADDIYSTRDRTDMMEALKALISERDHSITYKGIDSIQKQIVGNFIFTDNHKDSMKKGEDTRGICTLYCAQQSKYDRQRDGLTKDFFAKELYPWLEREGFAYVAYMLATMRIDARYNPAGECQEAPDTSVTHEAIVDGRTGLEHEVVEWVELQEPGFCGDYVSVTMLKKKMESIPRYSKSITHLKIKEMMTRLGYEMHRGAPDGRSGVEVIPDNTRPVLYVKRDTFAAEIKGAVEVGHHYAASQLAAIAAATEKRFNHG